MCLPITRYSPPTPMSCIPVGAPSVSQCLLYPSFLCVAIPSTLLVVSAVPPPLALLLSPDLTTPPPLHLYPPAGSCIDSSRPAPLLLQPPPPISPTRTKMSTTRWAGVIYVDRLQVGPRCAGSALAGPLLWWATASAVPYSCTSTNSSTPFTFGWHSSTGTTCWKGPGCSRLSAWCSYSTMRPALGPEGWLDDLQ